MLNPEPLFSFHDFMEGLIKKWRYNPNTENIVLRYSTFPAVWASIDMAGESFSLPVPNTPKPYISWGNWFKEYLEVELGIIARDMRLNNVYVMSNKGNLLPLYKPVPDGAVD